MNELLATSLAFPTVVYSVALGVCLLYWALVFLGALGVDLTGDGDADVDATDSTGSAPAVMGLIGLSHLGQVPITVAFSLVSLFGWFVSGLLSRREALLGAFVSESVLHILVLLVALLVAIRIAGWAALPLAPLFDAHHAPSRHSLVGRVVEVSTGEVNRRFGQARLEDGGAGLVLQVRCDPSRELRRGQQALIIEHNDALEFYEVEPMDALLHATSNDHHLPSLSAPESTGFKPGKATTPNEDT